MSKAKVVRLIAKETDYRGWSLHRSGPGLAVDGLDSCELLTDKVRGGKVGVDISV